jgi:hypothetical protein
MAIPFRPADPTVDGFIVGLNGWMVEAIQTIRSVIHEAAPGVTERIKGKVAVFDFDGPLCFIKPHMTHFNLCFILGDDLADPGGVLRNYGRNKIRHLKVSGLDGVDSEMIAAFVRSAVELNQA